MTNCTACDRSITGHAPDVFVCAETRSDEPADLPWNAVYCLQCAMRELPDAFSHRFFPQWRMKETQKR